MSRSKILQKRFTITASSIFCSYHNIQDFTERIETQYTVNSRFYYGLFFGAMFLRAVPLCILMQHKSAKLPV
jgi:hypothetical protein